MNKLFSVLFALTFFASSSLANAAPLTVHQSNPRYFTDGSGKAIFLTGSHTWNSLQDGAFFTTENRNPPPSFNFTAYLDFLRARNHNFIRMWRFETPKFYYWLDIDSSALRKIDRKGYQFTQPHPWLRTGPGIALDGKPKFDLHQFDPTYFQRMRERVIAARDRGIYVSVMLFEGGELRGKDPVWATWMAHPFHGPNNTQGIEADANKDGYGVEVHSLQNSEMGRAITDIQKAYIRKVVDTVNDLDNVLYEVGNEFYYSSENIAWQYWVVNCIKEYEATKPKQHPVGMVCQMYHPWKNGSTTDPRNAVMFNGPADWISPGNLGGSGYNTPDATPVTSGEKVILLDSDHLWGIGGDRSWVWKSFVRGHNVINMDTLPEITEHLLHYSKAPEIRAAMGHALTYANKMDLAEMTPSSSPSHCSTTYCLRNPGNEYLIYQPIPLVLFTVNLPAGTYSYEWFNPGDGAISSTGDFTVSTTVNRSFTPSFAGDAVLYIKKCNISKLR